MKKILLTGETGLIGSRFLDFFKKDVELLDIKPVGLSHQEYDLEDFPKVREVILRERPSAILHFAAFTDVDGAELQRGDVNGLCWRLNVKATRDLADLANKIGSKIIYVSTDFVFDGRNGPYKEEDEVAHSENDVSWYAWTKLMGEKAVKDCGAPFLIARTSYPYRANYQGKLDFVRNIIARLKNNNLYPMFDDQFLTPTFIDNFSKALIQLIKKDQSDIWHLSDSTVVSSYLAAKEIAEIFGYDPKKIEKGSLLEFQKKNSQIAKRPPKGGLKNEKIQQFLAPFGERMLTFEEALRIMKGQITRLRRAGGIASGDARQGYGEAKEEAS